MIALIKVLIEALLGGDLKKMLKNNNGLTTLNVILSLACLTLVYESYVKEVDTQNDVQKIKNVLYYRMNIDVNDQPGRRRDDSSEDNKLTSDVILTHSANRKPAEVLKEEVK